MSFSKGERLPAFTCSKATGCYLGGKDQTSRGPPATFGMLHYLSSMHSATVSREIWQVRQQGGQKKGPERSGGTKGAEPEADTRWV